MTQEEKDKLTWRQILLNRLPLRRKLALYKHFEEQKESLPYYDGGDYNTLFLKFKDEEDAFKVTRALTQEFNKLKGYFASIDNQGHITVRNATRLDKANIRR